MKDSKEFFRLCLHLNGRLTVGYFKDCCYFYGNEYVFLLFYLFEIRKVSIWVFKSHYVLPEQVNTGVHLFHHGYIVV